MTDLGSSEGTSCSKAVVLVSDDLNVFQSPLSALEFFEQEYDSEEEHGFIDRAGTIRVFENEALTSIVRSSTLKPKLIERLRGRGREFDSEVALADLVGWALEDHGVAGASTTKPVRIGLSVEVDGGFGWVTLTVEGGAGCFFLFASTNDLWTEVASVRSRRFRSAPSVRLEAGSYLLTCLRGSRDGAVEFAIGPESYSRELDIRMTLCG